MLVPDERGAKAYRLLLTAMNDAGMVGIARVVLRTKQYLCAVRPVGDALVLSTMNFADEVMGQEELDGLPGDEVEPSSREVDMANRLIESLSTEFEPDKYHDDYREKVMALIDEKASGKEVVVQPEAPSAAPVVDLMAALEASLAAAKKSDSGDGSSAKKAPAKKAKKAAKKAS